MGWKIGHEPEFAISRIWSPSGLRASEDGVSEGASGVSSARGKGIA